MQRIKGAKPSAALIVAVIALVAALGGGAVAGVAVTSLNKKDKKQVKKIAKKLDKKIALEPGPSGPKGEKGDPGQDATNLFAYVRDTGGLQEATVEYGDGVSGVTDPAGANDFFDPYVVTFDRNLGGCVAYGASGLGEPDGGTWTAGPNAMFADVDGSTVRVHSSGGDTAFMLSVFC